MEADGGWCRGQLIMGSTRTGIEHPATGQTDASLEKEDYVRDIVRG